MSSHKHQNDAKLQEELDAGQELFNTLLNNVHKGNFNEMYEYFKKKVDRIELYGDTKEKQVLKYCSFRGDLVMNMYR